MTIFNNTIIVSDLKFCPAHRLPHTLFGEKVCDERCHVHKNCVSMVHHKMFCKLLKCPHYDFMIKEYYSVRKEE